MKTSDFNVKATVYQLRLKQANQKAIDKVELRTVCYDNGWNTNCMDHIRRITHVPESFDEQFKLCNETIKLLQHCPGKAEIGWITEIAQKGNPLAQTLLGLMYHDGVHFKKDTAKSYEWYKKAMDQRNTLGQYFLAWCQCEMEEKSQQMEGFRLMEELANKGLSLAYYGLGILYEYGKFVLIDHNIALQWYLKAAEKGEWRAQMQMGAMYFNGKGVKIDYIEAEKWYSKAAENGHEVAYFVMGLLNYGDYLKMDKNAAFQWFRKAAEKGNPRSQYYLGRCYFHGEGVKMDREESIKWYLRAAEQGDAAAQWELATIYRLKYPNENTDDVLKWFTRSLKQDQNSTHRKIFAGYISNLGTNIEKYISSYFDLTDEVQRLKAENAELKAQIDFQPGGSGYQTAMKDFKAKAKSVPTRPASR